MHLPSSQTIFSAAYLVGLAIARPVAAANQSPMNYDHTVIQVPVDAPSAVAHFQPELYTILPFSRDVASDASQSIRVSVDKESEVQQLVVFRNIPTSAKHCMLHWSVAAKRNFAVENNGLVSISQLTSLPQGPITAASVEPLVSKASLAADFTDWVHVVGPHSHIAGVVQCQPEMAFRASINRVVGGAGLVFLEQTSTNGWYISYSG